MSSWARWSRRVRLITSPGRAPGSSFPSTSIAANAGSASSAIIPFASAPTATRRWRPRSSATRRPASSTGGYAGGQAEYVRVPMADVAPMKVPDGMEDEEVLFLTDIFPTGYQAAEQAGIKGGEIVAIWGTGPVGLFAIQSAKLLGAERIISMRSPFWSAKAGVSTLPVIDERSGSDRAHAPHDELDASATRKAPAFPPFRGR